MLSKLVPVVGNICEHNLGLDEGISDVIAEEVDVIVNSAANTTFDERLASMTLQKASTSMINSYFFVCNHLTNAIRYDTAININTIGPCRLMNIAKKCKKLKLFLHVSTGKTTRIVLKTQIHVLSMIYIVYPNDKVLACNVQHMSMDKGKVGSWRDHLALESA